MVIFRKAKIGQKPQYHIYINNGTGRELFYCTFYTTTGLKYKKLESERICPCILHWHPASKAFLLAYLRKTHARLLPCRIYNF